MIKNQDMKHLLCELPYQRNGSLKLNFNYIVKLYSFQSRDFFIWIIIFIS